MILLIDGYNLLKYIYGPSVGESQRRVCTHTIDAYARRQSLIPWIIYDGGVTSGPTRETYNAVTIIYAGWKSTADEYIQEYIGSKPHHIQELLLVSSDYELAVYADCHMIPSIDVALFWHLVQIKTKQVKSIHQTHQHSIKLSSDDNPELDKLMHRSDIPEEYNLQEAIPILKDKQKKSKVDTKLLSIIKKLL